MPPFAFRNFAFAPSGTAADSGTDAGTGTDDAVDASLDAKLSDGGDDSGEESVSDDDAPGEVPVPSFTQLRELAAKQGLTDLPDDPEQFVSSLAQQRAQAVAAQRERDAYAYHFRQLQQQSLQQQAPPQPKEPPKKPWEIPNFDRRMIQQLTKDAEGNVVARPGAIPTLPQDYAAWQEAREAAIDKLLNDPYAVLHGDAMKDFIQEQARSVAQQMFEQQQQQTIRENFIKENSDWLFDQQGNPTVAGQRMHSYVLEAEQQGLPKAAAIKWANDRINSDLYMLRLQQESAAAAAPAKPNPAQDRLNLLKKGAGHTGNKNGSTKTKAPQNTDRDKVWEAAREKAASLSREDLLSN